MNNLLLLLFAFNLTCIAYSQTEYPTNLVSTRENQNPAEWTLFFESNEVTIEYQMVNCDPSMGFDFEQVNLRFSNKTISKIDLDWHIHLYYDGECATCDYPEEYSRTIRLTGGETKEGNCDRETIDELKLFSKFTDENYTKGAKLTAFQLNTFMVSIITNE